MFIFLQNIFKTYQKWSKNILIENIYLNIFGHFCTFWNKIHVCTVSYLLDFDIVMQTGYCHPENSNL